MVELDITQTNREVDRLLEVTENPRHRFLLQAYRRRRALEMAGRYKEIFAPEMTVEQLEPQIRPLPSFDEAVLGAEPAAA